MKCLIGFDKYDSIGRQYAGWSSVIPDLIWMPGTFKGWSVQRQKFQKYTGHHKVRPSGLF